MSKTRRNTLVVLGLLLGLTLAGMYKGGALGVGTAATPEKITYQTKNTEESLGTKENPFTVLEIVPNKKMAAVGYLFSGSEPVDISKNTAAMLAYQKVYGDYDETAGTYGDKGIADVSMTDYCTFASDFPKDLGYGASEENKVSNAAEDKLHFGQYGYFEHAAGTEGSYKYVPAEGETSGYFAPIAEGEVLGENQATYTWVPLVNFEQTIDNQAPESALGTYFLTGNRYTNQGYDTTDDNNEFYGFEEGTSENPFFGVPVVSDVEKYYPENNEALTISVEEIGTNKDVPQSRYYQYRYEEFYHTYARYEIAHKNQWVKSLFPAVEKPEEFVTQVVTATPEQLKGENISGEHNIIVDADMVVIHDSKVAIPINICTEETPDTSFDQTFDGHDMEGDCFNALIHRQASGNPAMMLMDESAMAKAGTNLGKLYAVLDNVGAKYYYNVYCNSQETGEDNKPLWMAEKNPDAAENASIYQLPAKTGYFTGSSSYVLNWDGSDDFLTKNIGEIVTLTGEGDVTVSSAMSKMYDATCSRKYDAGDGTYSAIKTSLTILELEPIAEFYYGNEGWRSYYMDLLPKDFVGTSTNIADDVKVTTMATYEFNGKVEDLNSTYDMIVVGAKQNETNGLVTNGKGGYNDKNLNNYDKKGKLVSALAYSTIGDLVSTDDGEVYFSDYDRFKKVCNFDRPERFAQDNKHWIAGRIDAWTKNADDTVAQSASFIGSNKGSDIAQAQIRYNATDITQKKYKELLDFSVENLIVIDGFLYNDGKDVDDTVADSSSFIYSLAKIGTVAWDKKENKVVKYADAISSAVSDYDSMVLESRCDLVFSREPNETLAEQGQQGKPVEYSYQVADEGKKTIDKSTIRNNNQTDENGNNVLRYHFTLQGQKGAKYRVSLGIDNNGNGDFSDDETTEDLYILDTTAGVLENTTIDQSQGGYLETGHSYMVVRKLPSSEKGMLPWKLKVYNEQVQSIRYIEKGYTRIPGANPTVIKVLQMNLTSDDDMKENKDTKINFADTSTGIGKRFQTYLKGVEDYDIQMTFMSNYSQDAKVLSFNKYSSDAKKWTDYLMQYDMLILGFQDMAEFTDNEVFLVGFKAFEKAGKSVILSHDMVSDKSFAYPTAYFNYVNWNWQYEDNVDTCWDLNQETSAYLRQLSGQMTKSFSMTPDLKSAFGSYARVYSRGKQVSLLPKSDLQVAYLYRWKSTGLLSGYWEFTDRVSDGKRDCSWMTDKDYKYKVPGTGEYIGNLMDNSVRVMTFASRVKPEDRVDRVLTSPKNNNASVDKKELTWPDSDYTNTVKVANQGQITEYPFAIDDTISVANTHAQNYKLNLEENQVSQFDQMFGVDGDYMEWQDVPKTEVTWNQWSKDLNYGALVYSDGMAYGYAQVNEANSAGRNGGAFQAINLQVDTQDGRTIDHQLKIFSADENGNTNLYPQWEGLAPGNYAFYVGSTGFSSQNINNLNKNPYWHDDYVYGTMKMTITDGPDTMEYSLDMSLVAKWMGIEVDDIKDVTACVYGMSSMNDSPPRFSTKDTQDYVNNLGKASGGDAIVWFNLSNDGDDATNIYSAKDGDSANNYYIYTKGNITYTGFGHANDMTNDEIRLFINTMISAYRSTPAAPYVTVENEDVINNGSISTLYTEEREEGQDKEVLLKVNDDSKTTKAGTTYRMKITLKNKNVEGLKTVDGNDVPKNADGTYTVQKGAEYKMLAPYGDANTENTIAYDGKLTYKVSLTTTYADGTEQDAQRTVRVMLMPLFGLD